MKCQSCQVSSPIEEFFVTKKGVAICPACSYRRNDSEGIFTWIWVPFAIFIGHTLLYYYPEQGSAHLFIAAGWWMIFLYLSIAVHEFGHYFICQALGGRCPLVSIGEGRVLFEWHTKSSIWQFSANPSLGVAYAVFPPEKSQVWREVLMLLGGVLGNLLLIVVSVALLMYGAAQTIIAKWWWLLGLLIVVNALLIFGALFLSLKNRGLVSDGHAIFELVRLGRERRTSINQQWGYELVIADALVRREAFSELKQYLLSCERFRESAWHMISLSFYYAFTYQNKNFLKASEDVLGLLEAKGVDSLPEGAIEKYAYAIAQNNLAFALYSSNSDNMEKLLLCANEAYKLLPWENSVRGTYGAALIRSGANLMEGVKHLEAIIRNPMGAKNKTIAINYFCLAEGYKKLGEDTRANEAIRRAVTLNPDVARHFT